MLLAEEALHQDLTAFTVFAHTDIDIRKPELHCWTPSYTGGTRPVFPIVFKSHTYPQLLGRTEDLRILFDSVLNTIRLEQSELQAEFYPR